VQFAFGDDSKQDGQRAGMGKLLGLGAVVFPEAQLRPFSLAMLQLRDEHGIPRDVELKWAMPHGKANYFRQRSEPGLQDTIRARMLELAAAYDATACVVVWDLGRTTLQGDAAELKVLSYLYERIIGTLARTHLGVLVFDKPGGDHLDEDAWIGRTLELSAYGTDYVQPDSMVLPVLTAPSHHHEHLQLADLVVGCTTAAVAGNPYGMGLLTQLKPLLHKNYHGWIGGTGLKVFPNDLINLYFHVLGEDILVKVSQHTGYPLPDSQFAYFADDGLVGD
jgi:hypothetical protein